MRNTAMSQADQVVGGFIGAHAIIDAKPGRSLAWYPLVVDQHYGKIARVQFCQMPGRGARKDGKEASRQPGPHNSVDDITVIFLVIHISNAIQDKFVRSTAYDFTDTAHKVWD